MNIRKILIPLVSLAFLQGCASLDINKGTVDPSDPSINYAVVETYYATDRNLESVEYKDISPASPLDLLSRYNERQLHLDSPNRVKTAIYGDKRSELSYGISMVSIPRNHKMGQLERPSVLRFEFRENPDKHVVQLGASPVSKDDFFQYLNQDIRKISDASEHDAFIFIHGYNVSFEDAAIRTAQMKYDLAFPGVAAFYSWPSQGSFPAYTVDEQNIEWAEYNLRSFLNEFFLNSKAEHIHLIAHSMGNRALTRAVAKILEEEPLYREKVSEIILAAPDIDADVFKRDIAPNLVSSGTPVTLYSSSKDKALIASKKIHGYRRAGESGEDIIVILGIETIDATDVDTSFIGHSFYADSRSVLSDMFYLIHDKKRADERFGLVNIESDNGRYWKFKK